jgi:hypothetical protein
LGLFDCPFTNEGDGEERHLVISSEKYPDAR